GVYDSEIDGQYGPGTRKAISDWQISNNYEPTGFMTIPQQSELIKNYLKPLFENGIRMEKNILAGIKIPLPTDFRNPTAIKPPFITYEATPSSKIKVFLISQHGDDYDLKILFDAMQDLKIIPIEGKKLLLRNSFELSGRRCCASLLFGTKKALD
ncbi:peptidoglycan-binding protein, partial [Paracoccaceae bacterium]|nr:peptidoglycan-binding protein [Paracoccaceae bacterium]